MPQVAGGERAKIEADPACHKLLVDLAPACAAICIGAARAEALVATSSPVYAIVRCAAEVARLHLEEGIALEAAVRRCCTSGVLHFGCADETVASAYQVSAALAGRAAVCPLDARGTGTLRSRLTALSRRAELRATDGLQLRVARLAAGATPPGQHKLRGKAQQLCAAPKK